MPLVRNNNVMNPEMFTDLTKMHSLCNVRNRIFINDSS